MALKERRIAPIDVTITPPDENATLVGYVGKYPVYQTKKKWFRNVEAKDNSGNPIPVFRPGTNETLYNKRALEQGERDVFLIPNQERNGNLSWHEYVFPTEAEKAADERRKRVDGLIPEIAGALIDNDLTVDDLIRSMTRAPEEVPIAPTRSVDATDEFPRWVGSQKAWELSNGDLVKGNKALAVQAEAKLAV